MNYLPFLSTLVTFFFTGAVFTRYLQKKSAHLLFWSIGLLLYGLGTMSEIIMAFVFNAAVLKLWYLCGAMLTAAWLGQGTIALLVRKRGVSSAMAALLLVVSIVALVLVFSAPVVTSAAAAYDVSQPASTQYHDILERGGGMIFLTIILNIYGTIALVGGALYSAFLFWRKRVLANRMYGNLLIAAGALMPALGGTFTKAGLPDWLYVSELLGAILMYFGYLMAISVQDASAPTTASVLTGSD